jgi:hypothetical protein
LAVFSLSAVKAMFTLCKGKEKGRVGICAEVGNSIRMKVNISGMG